MSTMRLSPRTCSRTGRLQRGNPSVGTLAPANRCASEATSLFQSSYLFQEGRNSLRKTTAAASGKPAPQPSPQRRDTSLPPSSDNATVSSGSASGRIGIDGSYEGMMRDDQSAGAGMAKTSEHSLSKLGREELEPRSDRDAGQCDRDFRSLASAPRAAGKGGGRAAIELAGNGPQHMGESHVDVRAVLRRYGAVGIDFSVVRNLVITTGPHHVGAQAEGRKCTRIRARSTQTITEVLDINHTQGLLRGNDGIIAFSPLR